MPADLAGTQATEGWLSQEDNFERTLGRHGLGAGVGFEGEGAAACTAARPRA